MPDFNAIRFQPGQPLARELGADRLNTIVAEIKRNKPKGERGVTVRQTGEGTYIGLAKNFASRTGATELFHPWQIKLRADPSQPSANPVPYQFKVDAASRLYESLSTFTEVQIADINQWKGLITQARHIVLRATVASGAIDTVEIVDLEQMGTRITFSGNNQTGFEVELGYVFFEGSTPKVRQNFFQTLTMLDVCVNGKAALYPYTV